MHIPREASGLLLLALSASALVKPHQPTRSSARSLHARAGDSPPPPDSKPDDLPGPGSQTLITWTDDDPGEDDYTKNPDYDPDQDKDFGEQKRKRSAETALVKRLAPAKGTTEWLRSVTITVNGEEKGYRDAFIASSNQKWVTLTGTLGQSNQIGIAELNAEWPAPKPKPRGYKSPQVDHVNDLGMYTTIAGRDVPDGIDKNDWQTIADAVLGDDDDTEPSENTKTLGKELNDPANMRGVLYGINQFKNQIMGWAYTTQTQKSDYKAWKRSVVWGSYRYMKTTKDQFDETTDKATRTIESLIMDEDSAAKIAKYYKDEINKFYDRAITEMERVLTNGPDNADTPFKTQDCSNTKDSPNTPPDSPQPSASAAAAPQPKPTTDPVDPRTRKSCEDNPTNHVHDAHEGSLTFVARYFCNALSDDPVKTTDVNIQETWTSATLSGGRGPVVPIGRKWDEGRDGEKDDVYDISIASVQDCNPGDGGNDLKNPTKDDKCEDILKEAWKGCTGNQGRGGVMNAGCLTYGVKTRF